LQGIELIDRRARGRGANTLKEMVLQKEKYSSLSLATE